MTSTEDMNRLTEEFLTSMSPEVQRSKPSVTPTLVIGLGGTGTGVIRYLKRRLVWLWHREEIEAAFKNIPHNVDKATWQKEIWRRFEMEGAPPIIQLLAVDTVPWLNRPGDVYLNEREYAYIGGYNASRVIDNLENHPEIQDWWQWDPKNVRPGQIHSGARQIRAVGRLSFYRRYRSFWSKLKPQIDAMTSIEAKQEMEDRGYFVASSGEAKRVYIISSLCGGTGAGCILDAPACLRAVANFSESALITGIFAMPSVFLPDLNSDLQKDRVRANAYAALKELAHFHSSDFPIWLPGEEKKIVHYLYNRLYLIERLNEAGESLNQISDVQQMIANQIFLESITDVGVRIWEYDVNVTSEHKVEKGRHKTFIFSSFANSTLMVPKDEMSAYCELNYAAKLIREGLLKGIDTISLEAPKYSLEPEVKNEINRQVDNDLKALDALIQGRAPAVEGEISAETGSDEGEEEEEEDEGDETRSAPGTVLTITEDAPLEEFQKQINAIIGRYGLAGASYYLAQIAGGMIREMNSAQNELTKDQGDFDDSQQALDVHKAHRPVEERFSNIPGLNTLFRGGVERHARTLQSLQDANKRAGATRDSSQRISVRWERLQKGIKPLQEDLNQRMRILNNLVDEPIGQDIRRLFDTNRPKEQQPYEMFTMILGQAYLAELFPKLINNELGRQFTEDVATLLGNPRICQVDLSVNPHSKASGNEHYLKELRLVQSDKIKAYQEICAAASVSIEKAIPENVYTIRKILNSNNPRIQARLRSLFSRCKPFWRFDLDIGGFNEKDMEEVVFAGVDGAVEFERDWKYLFRDFPDFDTVETNDPQRIDACRVRHGLPLEYLENLEDLHSKYREFFEKHEGPLHLDSHWESDEGSLEDLVGGKPDKNPVNTAPPDKPATPPEPEPQEPAPVAPKAPPPGDGNNNGTPIF